ncbi:MATE family efflux transporter [Romboutsia timonensis]|uniref:MATE family efflux transporter n=1 Tax=Romboutsia timonensis TaxID=1776391 RepID=UPI002A7F4849|nr:MATE family efflux transporter [Romboutsia timonensis]MDY3958814.1 MATE family efflux transporter [Romboutsia timonensis]
MEQELFRITPPKQLFIKFAIPSLVSMLFSGIYMMCDGMFVGKVIGSKALAAINLVFPIIMIVFAVGDMIVAGASVKIGIKLGERRLKEASNIFSIAILLMFIIDIIFIIIGLAFTKDIIFILIKDRQLAQLSYRFAYVFILALPIIAPFSALDNYLRLCGKVNLSMWVNIFVSILNTILDIIFIGYFKLGIEYVALSSVLSMFIGTLIFLYPFIMKKVALRFTKPKVNAKDILYIIYNGSPEFLNNISGSIMSIITNGFLLNYGGSVGVAAFSIVMYIDALISPLLFGVIGCIQPVISYNYGARNYKRITQFFKITCIVGFTISIATMSITLMFPDFLVGLFSSKSDVEIIRMGKIALSLSAPSYLFNWFSMIVVSFLTGLEKPTESIVVMLLESVMIPLILTVVLTKVIGVYGIFIIPSICGFISTAISFILWRKCVKEEFKININI